MSRFLDLIKFYLRILDSGTIRQYNELWKGVNTVTSTFSERLKLAMDLCGYRQVDVLKKASALCKALGVKLASGDLSQYLSGKTVPRAKKLAILGQVLCVDDNWLIGRDVPMERSNVQIAADKEKSMTGYMVAVNNTILKERDIRKIGILYYRATPEIRQAVRLILAQYEQDGDCEANGYYRYEL